MGPFSPFNLSLAVFLAFLSLQGADSSCLTGWLKRGNQCFGFFNVTMQWQDAEVACQAFGENGHLASIHDEDDMKALSQHLSQNYKGSQHIWIGLHNPNTGSENNWQFKWTDGTTGRYTPWAPGLPSIDTDEHCVELFSNGEEQKEEAMGCFRDGG
ncbi:C-type lectin-like [Podarcis raffonei]|uniref:C-type lectin-like n=1 Tax=Podarcis raffonei TaxID=65483 RepID=UPI0023293C28|nr:C-type lectin-like [Podarcis raffonei]XP_053262593.1 C-type lectin-like [Podarcis raffonei]XP_053262594.1 C-type lectin-like [Podarcis raffonei]XP_053262596.1 C-type lectin-like [Podarcis raffonei]